MSYYFVASIKIKVGDEYQKYLDKVDEVFSKFNGKYLVLDDNPRILEGKWDFTRSVIIEFVTEADFNEWYNSKEYQEILKHRLNASECVTILVRGK